MAIFRNTRGGRSQRLAVHLDRTAKANSLDPYAYLRYIFDRLPTASSLEDYEALLPWNIALDQVKGVFTG